MQHIIDIAQSVLEEYAGKDIFETAENAGTKVWYRQLGGLKGFYVCENSVRYIVINEKLDRMMKRVVCAHELGHDMLHRELAEVGIRENTLFLSSNKTEREANLFAACVLISDEALLDELAYNDDIEAAAYSLGVPTELVCLKLELLNYKGYRFNLSETKSDFLK